MNEERRTPRQPAVSSAGVSGDQETAGAAPSVSAPERLRTAEARLIQQLRQGDAEAGREFVRAYYPDVYRYLLYLARRPEMAERPFEKPRHSRAAPLK